MRTENAHSRLPPKGIIFNDGRITLLNDIPRKQYESVMLTDLLGILLCRKGKAQFDINEKPWTISKGDILVVQPNIIFNSSLFSIDFECVCVFLSVDYLQRLVPLRLSWNVKDAFKDDPVQKLTSEQEHIFMQYFDMLSSRGVNYHSARKNDVVDALMLAFILEMYDFKNRDSEHHETKINASDDIYTRFGHLLYSTYPKNRSVNYYAEQLCITPKYLSSICKKASGLTATQIIDAAVIEDIKHQLEHNTKSIKQIAYDMDFPEPAAFGKYVKRLLGISPIAYRNTHVSQAPNDIPQE